MAFLDQLTNDHLPTELLHHTRSPIARIQHLNNFRKFEETTGAWGEERIKFYKESMAQDYQYKAFMRELMYRSDSAQVTDTKELDRAATLPKMDKSYVAYTQEFVQRFAKRMGAIEMDGKTIAESIPNKTQRMDRVSEIFSE